MSGRKPIVIVVFALVVVVVGAIAFFFGNKHAVESMTIKRITATQAADAMHGDHFYSDYRENTLILSGAVSSVNKSGNGLVVTFTTDSSFKTQCTFDNPSPVIHRGEVITALSEGGSAERQSSAVLLKDCVLLG